MGKFHKLVPGTLKFKLYQTPARADVINIFTVVIYLHSMVIPLFFVVNLYYHGNYCEMAVYYYGKKFFNIDPWWQT
jgi:hypothetical protein